MTHDDAPSLLPALERLLDRERQALIDGDLGRLSDLVERKQDLIDRINALGAVDGADLDQLRRKVSRNQELLNSALDGIRAVAGRIAELRRVRRGLETYDRSGRKTCIETRARPNVEKRA